MGQSGKTTLLTPVDVMKADWLSRKGVPATKTAESSAVVFKPSSFQKSEYREYIIDPGSKTTYLRGKFLGKGGFARVHELTDLSTNQVYAGKIIPKSKLAKPHQREKILREIDLHRKLQHKNVVNFHHFFEDEHNAYIVMENCPRKSLVHVLRNRRRLTEPEVRYFMLQLTDGVRYTHGHGVVHRDLKLGNMLLSEDMQLKIADFGLAAPFRAAAARGTVCGTPNYIAPEVLTMQGHGFPADVWAMGCIMYAMLVGHPPFETPTLGDTFRRIAAAKFALPASLSPPARHLLRQMLQRRPEDRPSLPNIARHPFFAAGPLPAQLPATCCVVAPALASLRTVEHVASQENLDSLIKGTNDLQLDSKSQNSDLPKIQPNCDPPPVSPKKDKCFPTNFRQKLTNVLCPDKVNKKSKPVFPSQVMYNMVVNALEKMPSGVGEEPAPLSESLGPFITKWIDYSNKYGFGFQLSDRSVGVLFNDDTRMSLSSNRGRVEFHDTSGKMSSYSCTSVPNHLQERFVLLNFFVQYMDGHLTEGHVPEVSPHQRRGPVPPLRRWVRSSTAIAMQLSSGTLQVNFLEDHCKLVLSPDGRRLLLVGGARPPRTFALAHLAASGCSAEVRVQLEHVATVLREFVRNDA